MERFAKVDDSFVRSGGHPLGVHRVLAPKAVLPQAAERLDSSLPIYDNELLLDVECLNLDSASFRQLSEEAEGDVSQLSERILQITNERGKMENPITGSGGMLVGKVRQVGPEFPQNFSVGQRLATLVSLTLTPLHLETIDSIHPNHAQVQVQGHGILFASGVAAPMPGDLPDEVALAVFDVCGAPAAVKRLVKAGDKVLVMGLGKAGVLSAFAAREVMDPKDIWLSDVEETVLEAATGLGLGGNIVWADAQQPLHFQAKLKQSGAPEFDWVINTCNAPETEMAALLAVRPGGQVLFFNMATQFSRAVLSAEGMGKDVTMIMGNGFSPGHWEGALQLVRHYPVLRQYWEKMEAKGGSYASTLSR